MTDGPGTGPSGTPATSPFDEHGRVVRGRANPSAPLAGPLTATPPGTVPGIAPGLSPDGVPGTAPMLSTGGGAPLNWPRSGPIPLGLTGPLTLTGGLSLGRARKKKQTVSGFDPVIRGRGLARLSRRPQPTTASEMQRATVRWIVTLWIMVIVTQRFGFGVVPLLLPLSIIWCVYGLARGVLEPDRHRLGWFLAAAGVSAMIVPLQNAFSPDSIVSLNSWGLLLVTFVVFVFRLRDRRRSTYLKALQSVFKVSIWQAGLVIFFLVSQFAVPYKDWLAAWVPSNLLLHHYTLAYPFSYGGTLYRSNGWIGLETSFTSIQLALGVVAALLLRKKLLSVLFLLAAIACTGALSGVVMLAAAVATMLISPMRWALARYAVMVPTLVAFLVSPLGSNMIGRLTEGTSAKSSTGQRSTVPYELMWPLWSKNPLWVLLGRGPSSSQTFVEQSHVQGVIVPTPIKLFFDFGVVAGLVLAAFLLFMNFGGPSRAVALAMISQYWLFQPGTGILLVITIPLFTTWWTPRSYQALESDIVPSPNAAIVPAQPNRRSRTELLT